MDYLSFLTRVIDEGITAATASYAGDSDRAKDKREGAIAGFEACRGKSPDELTKLLAEARHEKHVAYREQRDNYWYFVCYGAEIEWTCNVVSSALMNQNLPTIVAPTARGYMKAAEILGVADLDVPSERYRSPT